MIVYPLERLYEEMAYLAYHLHWPYSEILKMDHADRQRWLGEVGHINSRLNSLAEVKV